MVVIATSAAVTTGARDRQRLRAYFARIPRTKGRIVAWKPTGLWEQEAVQAMAPRLSVLGGIDAIADPAPSVDVAYATLVAEGLRRSFSYAQLQDVYDKLQGAGAARAYVTIESPQSFREARLLQALSEGRE
ncbi:MAG: hypothetical protein HKN10_06410 [Myxococcales bacterium]|nr:hypothetical protein [Myxococcales bacterium]